MKSNVGILVISVACLSYACSKPEVNPLTAAPSPQPSPATNAMIPKDGNHDGKGRVTKIDLKLGSVEIDHEPMPSMLMPEMKMEFMVKEKSLLTGLKVGDTVNFTLEYKHPTEIVVGIKKAK